MISVSVLSAVTLMFAAAPDTALAYAEALARAERYEKDPAAERYRTTVMQPPLRGGMPPILDACSAGTNLSARPNFTVVVSFKGGKFEAVRHTSDHPVAQCIAERMSRLAWPAPPYPDFAEEFHLELAARP